MTKPRGILNKNAFTQIGSAFASSGILRSRKTGPNFTYDVNANVIQLQKRQAIVEGAGRLSFAAGERYIPEYDMGWGVGPGSGYTVISDGIYQVDGYIAVSGAANNEVYGGEVLVDGVAVSGTETSAFTPTVDPQALHIRGVVHAASGQVINISARSLFGSLTSVGSEDLVVAPAANLRVIQIGAEELPFFG